MRLGGSHSQTGILSQSKLLAGFPRPRGTSQSQVKTHLFARNYIQDNEKNQICIYI